MVDRLPRCSRIAFGAAVGFLGVSIVSFLIALGQSVGGGGSRSESHALALAETLCILAILVNSLAFFLAILCWVKASRPVPWMVLTFSGLLVCATAAVFLLAFFGRETLLKIIYG